MIKRAETDQEIFACFPVLKQLRPHLHKEGFLRRIHGLVISCGYRLAYLDEEGIKAVAGYRIADWLHAGKYLEIEDLVVSSECRSEGYGSKLFDWMIEQARAADCAQVRLLSGVQRERAHKFYLNKGMTWEAKYFSINI